MVVFIGYLKYNRCMVKNKKEVINNVNNCKLKNKNQKFALAYLDNDLSSDSELESVAKKILKKFKSAFKELGE